jgi:hypothetical protein
VGHDSNRVKAPVASVDRAYQITTATTARTAPRTSARAFANYAAGATVPVSCQTPGSRRRGTAVWNRLTNGSYVGDADVSRPPDTGYSAPIPRCYYPYQVWNRLDVNSYATDHHLTTPSHPGYSAPVPRC